MIRYLNCWLGLQMALHSLCVRAEDLSYRTVLDESPVAMPRASGMAGAASGVADGVEALYHNPAGIGGLESSPQKYPWVRQLQFPYAGAATNEDYLNIQDEYNSSGAASDGAITEAVLQANAGKRVYARFSMLPNIVIGRIFLGVAIDNQLAAVPVGDGSRVETRYRETIGPISGFSLTNSRRTLFFGMSLAMLSRKETVGQFEFAQINDPVLREEVFKEARSEYDGQMTNAGLLWRMGQKLNPTLSVIARNIGETRYVARDSGREDVVVGQDLGFGFSLTPWKTKQATVVTTLQADDLENTEKNINKKIRLGSEMLLGSESGERATFGLRAGYNSAGLSFGAQLNFSLFGLQYASYAEDVGLNNRRVIDRRQEVTLKIDISER